MKKLKKTLKLLTTVQISSIIIYYYPEPTSDFLCLWSIFFQITLLNSIFMINSFMYPLNNHLFKRLPCIFQKLARYCRYGVTPGSCLSPNTNTEERFALLHTIVFLNARESQKSRLCIMKLWKCQTKKVIFKSLKA